jgi:hypothetical protein
VFVAKKNVKIQNIPALAKLVRLRMNSYFDKFGRLHHKPCINGEPAGNNGWIYSAYFHKAGGNLNSTLLNECFRDCVKQHPSSQLYTNRHPDGYSKVPQSRDEILGMASLGFLHPMHLNGWSFSPYPIPAFSLTKLIKQLWELRPEKTPTVNYENDRVVEWQFKHRNFFWQNNLDQIYRFAFSVPLQDRAFILECWGETRSLRYFFYKTIAFIDSKISKPKNGIPWLKYGGDERKKIMQTEFPADHPLQKV